jgi:phosphatidylinositol-3-phosphatase
MPKGISVRTAVAVAAALAGVCLLIMEVAPSASASGAGSPKPEVARTTSALPAIRHVFVIMLENNDYSATFGSPSRDPYLATTLPSQGALLEDYYGIGHFSNDNYAAFISGQPPNPDNQLDCLGSGFANFPAGDGQGAHGIQQGSGCVYPSTVTTLAQQLTAKGFTWKGYQEDMGNDPARDGGLSCAHPQIGAGDPTTSAEARDGYTTRHDPFM